MNTATNTITLNFQTMQMTTSCKDQGWCRVQNSTSVQMAREFALLREYADHIRTDRHFHVFDATPAQQHRILIALSEMA